MKSKRDKWAEAEADIEGEFNPRPQWIAYPECRETSYVNCTFGNTGPCKNPNHIKEWGAR